MSSKRILIPYNMGGQKVTNAADGSANTDLATVGQVNTLIGGLAAGLIYKGTFDASALDFDALTDASQGDFYKVSAAGTIDSVLYSIGDMIIINKDVTGVPVTADIDKIDNTEAVDILRTGDIGVSVAAYAHNHTGVYEPANSNIQTHIAIVDGNPHGTDKTDVGLGNVTNDAQVKLSTVTAENDFIVATGAGAVTNKTAAQVKAILDVSKVADSTTNGNILVDGSEVVVYAHPTVSYSTDVGNGSDNTFVVTHSLNSKDLVVAVRDNASPYDFVEVYAACTTVDTVTIDFGEGITPTAAQYRVIILKA